VLSVVASVVGSVASVVAVPSSVLGDPSLESLRVVAVLDVATVLDATPVEAALLVSVPAIGSSGTHVFASPSPTCSP
jgi:hypothetical protein